MNKLLKVEYRTLNNWKNGARTELYNLLSSLDYESAKKLLTLGDKESYVRVLENEKYFDSQLDFEKELYPLLLNRDVNIWCKNRSKPDNDARVRPDAKTEFNRTVKRCSTGH
jgi:hypothetical protein